MQSLIKNNILKFLKWVSVTESGSYLKKKWYLLFNGDENKEMNEIKSQWSK